MIDKIVDFYKFICDEVDYERFCQIAGKNQKDAWASGKYQAMKRDLCSFMSTQKPLAKELYKVYLKSK